MSSTKLWIMISLITWLEGWSCEGLCTITDCRTNKNKSLGNRASSSLVCAASFLLPPVRQSESTDRPSNATVSSVLCSCYVLTGYGSLTGFLWCQNWMLPLAYYPQCLLCIHQNYCLSRNIFCWANRILFSSFHRIHNNTVNGLGTINSFKSVEVCPSNFNGRWMPLMQSDPI